MTQIGSNTVEKREDLKEIPTKTLLDFFNQKTGRQVTKFASREAAFNQVWKLIEGGKDKPPAEKSVKKSAKKTSTASKSRIDFNAPAASSIKKHREGTPGRAVAIPLLLKGATFEEVMKATGWNEKQAYSGIRRLNIFLGWGIKHNLDTGSIKIHK